MRNFRFNKTSIFYPAIFVVAVGSAWNVGSLIKWNYENNKPIQPEKMIEMGLKLSFFPEEIRAVYLDSMQDNKLTVQEYKAVKGLMDEHVSKVERLISEREKFAVNKDELTPLQYAEQNLKAFEEYGRHIVTNEQYLQIKKIMQNKITQERLKEKTSKNP